MKQNKIFSIILLSVIFFTFLPWVVGAQTCEKPGGLVPCGRLCDDPDTLRDERAACQICDIFELIDRIWKFILTVLMPGAAIVLYIIAGILILLYGANPGLQSTGKNIFKTTTWGLIIILAAWMLTNTVMRSLAGDSIDRDKPWYVIECVNPAGPAPVAQQRYACGSQGCVPNAGGSYTDLSVCQKECPTSAPSGDLQRLTQQVLASDIRLSTSGDCGSNFNARKNVEDIAAGRLAAVCSSTCDCRPGGASSNVTLNPNILAGLLALNNWMREQGIPGGFTVTSLMTGRHSATSKHYTGEAVDIVPGSSDRTHWQRIRNFLRGYGGNSDPICEGSGGSDVESCSGVNHIHWTLLRGD